MTVQLRAMRWTDIDELVAAEQELFGAHAWSTRTWWSELAARPQREYVVAQDGDRVVGYAGLDHTPGSADVMTIAVLPDRQGSGLGRRLLAELLDRAMTAQAASLLLEVRADNTAAIGLYRQAGFEVLSTRRRYYQPEDVDALVMRKRLV